MLLFKQIFNSFLKVQIIKYSGQEHALP